MATVTITKHDPYTDQVLESVPYDSEEDAIKAVLAAFVKSIPSANAYGPLLSSITTPLREGGRVLIDNVWYRMTT